MSRFAVPVDPSIDQRQVWRAHQLTPSSDTCSSATLQDIGSPASETYYEDGQKCVATAYTPRSSDPLAVRHRQAHYPATMEQQQRHMEDDQQQRQQQFATRQHRRLASYPVASMPLVDEHLAQQKSTHEYVDAHGNRNIQAGASDAAESVSWPDRMCRFRADWHASIAQGGAFTQLLHACMGEFLGNFFIALPVALTIAESFMIDGGQLDSGKFVNIALTLGVSVALSVLCFVRIAGTSLHSSVTVCMALFGRIAWWRVPFQLAAQCLGAFVAELVANCVYWNVMVVVKKQILAAPPDEDVALNVLAYSTIFQTLKQYGRSGGQIFVAELVSSFLAAIAIASCFDRVNPLAALTIAGPLLGAFYVMHTIAFTAASTMGNPAHDLGSRMACAALLGRPESCFYASETANAFLTPILGMLIGFVIFFFFLSSGSEVSKMRGSPASEAGQSIRQVKRAFLRPFQYRNREVGSARSPATNPHRRVVSFGNKTDSPQGFQNFVRLQESDVAHVVATQQQEAQHQQRHPSSAESADSIRWAAARKSWRHEEAHEDPVAVEHVKAYNQRRSSIASGHWLVRSDSVGSSQNGLFGRRPGHNHSSPFSEAVPMATMDGHGLGSRFDGDEEGHAI